MTILVLLASPTIAFGELIRLTLEGEGNYRVTRVDTGCEALTQCQSTPFDLAILDADLNDLPLRDLFAAVQKLRPGIRLILVPPHGDSQSPTIAGLPSHGYLSKPFYLPDLLNIVTRALRLQAGALEAEQTAGVPLAGALEAEQTAGVPPAGAPEAEQAAGVPPAGAPEAEQAAGVPPAGATPVPPKTPTPAIDDVSPKRPPSKPLAPTAPAWLQDVARAAQHLTRLSLETAALAALIIRDGKLWAYAGQLSQPAAQELAQTIAHYWERGNGSDLARFVHLNATDGDYMLYATAVSRDMALAMIFDIEMPFSKIRSQASHLARSLASPPGNETLPTAAQTLSPTAPAAAGEDHAEGKEPLDLAGLTPLFDNVPPSMPSLTPPSQPPSLAAEDRMPVPAQPPLPAVHMETLNRTQPQALQPEPAVVPASAESLQDVLEPASPAICNLSYVCMMIPRMPQHSVEGDLAQRLSEWTQQLCLAYGWRLDRLVVNPEYVEWVMNLPPSASPSYMMRIFRQQTSARIFADFPALGRDNPSGDFWAPGYLIMSSNQLPPESLVKDFLKQTRRRQGVSYPLDIKKVHG